MKIPCLSPAVHQLVWLATFVLWAPAAASLPYGIAAHIPPAPVLDEIEEAGIEWIRIDLVWALVETEQDVFNWSLIDDLLDASEARDLRVFATISGTPEWATSGSLFSGRPEDTDDWRDFCFRAADRYQGRIHAWGLWNEANQDHFWEGTRSQYVNDILIAGAESVSAAYADAVICGPDLAHVNSAHWHDWLGEVVRTAGSILDVVTHHVYPSDSSPSDVTEKLEEGSPWPWDPPSVRSVLRDAGWQDRPVWLTETGVESDAQGEPIQSAFYSGFLAQWFGSSRNHTWIDRVFFYEISDDPRYPEMTFGILSAPPELERKQAFFTYQRVIATTDVDDAEFIEARVPPHFQRGQEHPVTYVVRNSGTTGWEFGFVRLKAECDIPGWTIEGGDLGWKTWVSPGETIEIPLTVRSPVTAPYYPIDVHLRARLERVEGSPFGEMNSRTINLSFAPPPRIISQPVGRFVDEGGETTLVIAAEGGDSLSFQWRRHSIDLEDDDLFSGAASRVLHVHEVDRHNAGAYQCIVSSIAGSVVSDIARITLGDGPGPDVPPRRPGGRYSILPDLLERWRAFRNRAAR